MQINGAALTTIRERTGLTQSDLARATDGVVSQGRISEIESCDTKTVRPATGIALAKALSISILAITVPAPAEVA